VRANVELDQPVERHPVRRASEQMHRRLDRWVTVPDHADARCAEAGERHEVEDVDHVDDLRAHAERAERLRGGVVRMEGVGRSAAQLPLRREAIASVQIQRDAMRCAQPRPHRVASSGTEREPVLERERRR
jgi:hypothetical protein